MVKFNVKGLDREKFTFKCRSCGKEFVSCHDLHLCFKCYYDMYDKLLKGFFTNSK